MALDIREGGISWHGTRAPAYLEEAILAFSNVASKLRGCAVSLPATLASNAGEDASAEVRSASLVHLVAIEPDAPATESVLSLALVDPHADVRRVAAGALGPERVIAKIRDGQNPRAIRAFGEIATLEEHGAFLSSLADPVAEEVLASLRRASGGAAAGRLSIAGGGGELSVREAAGAVSPAAEPMK